jgi:AraC family transcriptional regulator
VGIEECEKSVLHDMVCGQEHAVPEGGYFGKTIAERSLAGILATESAYVGGEVLPAHSHASATLCYVVKGAFEELWDQTAVMCEAGALIYRPAGCPHTDRFNHSKAQTFGLALPLEWDDIGPKQPSLFRNPTACKVVSRIYREFSDPDGDSAVVVSSFVDLLQDELARIPDRGEIRAPRWLSTVRGRILDEYRRTLTLEELARDAGVHPMHLSREFARFYKCSVGEYARSARVHRACALLQKSAMTLGMIALETGFYDQAHFTRTFTKLIGCTPGEFRKTL